jgi:surfeit locus 1 family protein
VTREPRRRLPPAARTLLVALGVVAIAALCVRLGLWQLSRWQDRQALLRSVRAALAAPPVVAGDSLPPLAAVRGRRVSLRGTFDGARHVLLAGRERAGEPGVHVVTALRLTDGSAVLVDRGWLPALDGATADPTAHPAPGVRSVLGVAVPLDRGAGGPAMIRTTRGGAMVWTTLRLDHDSLIAGFPYPLAPYAVVESPGPGAAKAPAPQAPAEPHPGMHLSYALQWFAIALIVLAGSAMLARSRARRP